MHLLRIIPTLKYFKCISSSHPTPSTLYSRVKFSNQQIPISKSENTTKGNLATISEPRDIISLKINSEIHKFPSIWLRDNCQCPVCFRRESQSRTIDWEKFDFGTKPVSVKLEDYELEIEWSDGHRSIFSIDWLKERNFTEEKRKLFREQIYRFKRVTWGAKEFKDYLQRFDYKTILNEKSVLLDWLESLTKYGVSIVTNVPAEKNSIKILTESFSFARRTHYGEKFVVQARDCATNVAYWLAGLPLHTDLPYYSYMPGVNLLHCMSQSQGQGGDSQLVDGFHVANYLKLNYPAAYKVLTKTLVDWSDIGHENGDHFHSLYQAPVFCEDESGELVRINFSQPQRDSHFNSPLDQITAWYEAAGLFTQLLYSPDNSVTFKLAEGEILTFDNQRLLHGRSSYVDTVGRERLLIGCYIDWDEIYSRIRVLRKQLKKNTD